jgi:hypothetical protein
VGVCMACMGLQRAEGCALARGTLPPPSPIRCAEMANFNSSKPFHGRTHYCCRSAMFRTFRALRNWRSSGCFCDVIVSHHRSPLGRIPSCLRLSCHVMGVCYPWIFTVPPPMLKGDVLVLFQIIIRLPAIFSHQMVMAELVSVRHSYTLCPEHD